MHKIIAALMVLAVLAACADPAVAPPQPVAAATALKLSDLEYFDSIEEAMEAYQAQPVTPQAIAVVGWFNWTPTTVSTFGYFQYLNANYAEGSIQLVTEFGNMQEYVAPMLTIAESRIFTGGRFLDPWPHMRLDISAPVTRRCGLRARAWVNFEAAFYVFIKVSAAKLFWAKSSDQAWSDQEPCSTYDGGGAGGENCGMFVVQVQDDVGSWYDVGDPFQVCGEWTTYAMSQRKRSSLSQDGGATDAGNQGGRAGAAGPVKVHVRAERLDNAGARVEVDANGTPSIIVDQERTTDADADAALAALRGWSKTGGGEFKMAVSANDIARAERSKIGGGGTNVLHALRVEKSRRAGGLVRR